MSALIVIASAEFIEHESCARRLNGGQYLPDGSAKGSFRRDDEWMRLSNVGADYRDSDPISLARIQATMPNPKLLFVESNSEILLDGFLLTLPDHPDLLVVSPIGLILPLHKAKELASSDQDWMRLAAL